MGTGVTEEGNLNARGVIRSREQGPRGSAQPPEASRHGYCNGPRVKAAIGQSVARLVEGHVPRSETDRKAAEFFLGLCGQRCSGPSGQEPDPNHKNEGSHPLNQCPALSQVIDPEPLKRRGGQLFLRRTPRPLPEIHAAGLSPSLHQRDLRPLRG